MNAIPPTHIAVRHTRMLLIKAGLDEDEADRFIDRLTKEITSGSLKNEDERVLFIERELARLEETQKKTASKVSGDLRNLVIGIVGGVGGNYLTRAIDKAVDNPATILPPAPSGQGQESMEIIQVEWAIADLTKRDLRGLESALRTALQFHERQHGTLTRTAVYLDGLGMVLDAQGRHGEAARLRRQAVDISSRANGPDHESTGAAMSNLGVCLFRQRKYAKSDEFLAKGFRILMNRLGPTHNLTAGAIFNIYHCLYVQGRLLQAKIAPEVTRGMPEIRRHADVMTAFKVVIVGLLGVRDLVRLLSITIQN